MKRLLLFLVGNVLVFMVVLCVCFFVPRLPELEISRGVQTMSSQTINSQTIEFYVAQYVYHTGIILPVQVRTANWKQDWSKDFPCLQGCTFVEFGWGDRQFYMTGAETVGMALEALFASKSSVASIIGLDAPRRDAKGRETFTTRPVVVRRVRVGDEEYKRLVAYFASTFARAEEKPSEGKPLFLREGFWGVRSAFYAANVSATGQYSIVNNCNVWSSNALHAACVRTPLWAGIPQPLVWMLPE